MHGQRNIKVLSQFNNSLKLTDLIKHQMSIASRPSNVSSRLNISPMLTPTTLSKEYGINRTRSFLNKRYTI